MNLDTLNFIKYLIGIIIPKYLLQHVYSLPNNTCINQILLFHQQSLY